MCIHLLMIRRDQTFIEKFNTNFFDPVGGVYLNCFRMHFDIVRPFGVVFILFAILLYIFDRFRGAQIINSGHTPEFIICNMMYTNVNRSLEFGSCTTSVWEAIGYSHICKHVSIFSFWVTALLSNSRLVEARSIATK